MNEGFKSINKCEFSEPFKKFSQYLELAKKIRLKPSRRIEFFNATIDCRLLEYELYAGTKRVDKAIDTNHL